MAQTSETKPHHRALKLAAPVFAGLLLLGACSKKEEPPAATSTAGNNSTTTAKGTTGTTDGGGGTTGTTSKGGKSGTTVLAGDTIPTADTVFWTTGFKVTLPDGKYDKDKETLTFKDATIENLGDDNSTLYGTYSLEADGTVAYTGHWTESPSVIAKSKAKDTLVFENVDEKFDASATTMVIGSGNEAQVRIPFGDGEKVLRQPVIQDFKGKYTIGVVDIDVSQTEVRWDRPDNHAQAEKGKAFLVMHGKVKNNNPTNTIYWDATKAVLVRPDDTKTGAEALLGGGSVSATQIDDKWGIIWVIDEPVKGDYKLEFTQGFGPESADVTFNQDLKLVDKASSSTTGTTKP